MVGLEREIYHQFESSVIIVHMQVQTPVQAELRRGVVVRPAVRTYLHSMMTFLSAVSYIARCRHELRAV